MSNRQSKTASEFQAAVTSSRKLLWSAFGFSLFVNILMLTSPLFMMQVYDRVLASGSIPTLLALLILVSGLYLTMGLLDWIRGRLMARSGARLQSNLDGGLFSISLKMALKPSERTKPNSLLKDLESVQQFLSGPGVFGYFDVPWIPIYLFAVFLLHPELGVFVTIAATIIFIVAVLGARFTSKMQSEATNTAAQAEKTAEMMRQSAQTVKALGMGEAALRMWQELRLKALTMQINYSDRSGAIQNFSKIFRQFLQTAVLAYGAWLAIRGDMSPGSIMAGSILMGRALSPIDQAIGHWQPFLRARQGWLSLKEFMENVPDEPKPMELPPAQGNLSANNLVVGPPGTRTPLIQGVNFELPAGSVLGVIGPSASGKSTFARALVGAWAPLAGELRLDGATLDQWESDALGKQIGYLPQDPTLFTGTIAQNISRFDEKTDTQAILRAAQIAGAHELILKLPDGYESDIGEGGAQLSGGQRQRIGLARALYGDPALLVLDEPNAHLDSEGEATLMRAIQVTKAAGHSTVIMAHRPNAIQVCDSLLVFNEGVMVDFGPRDDVLRKVIKAA
jgi:ATP-binding cassette subfamily C protein